MNVFTFKTFRCENLHFMKNLGGVLCCVCVLLCAIYFDWTWRQSGLKLKRFRFDAVIFAKYLGRLLDTSPETFILHFTVKPILCTVINAHSPLMSFKWHAKWKIKTLLNCSLWTKFKCIWFLHLILFFCYLFKWCSSKNKIATKE